MDIKRTVLWVIFSFSSLLLWDTYNRSNGEPSIFFDNPTKQTTSTPAPSGDATLKATSVPSAAMATSSGSIGTGVPTGGVVAVKSEVITITTDLMKVDIDTVGGEVRRLELLQHHESGDEKKNVVLFDVNGQHSYLGQTGLIGGAYPNHKSTFTALPGPRSLDTADQVQLVLQSEQEGVKLIKTLTFKRGEYEVDVKHDVVNNTGAAITPSLYMQLVHDGASGNGGSMFMASTFTGPAIYTDTDKYQKITFESIEKGKVEHALKGNSGWIALVQHYFVSAFVPNGNTEREYFSKKLATNLYAVGTIVPMGSVAPGATASMDATLYSGPQESSRLEAVAPGFDLVKDYGWLTIIAKPIFWLMIQIHAILGNWGWTIIVLTIVIKLVFFPLSAAGYRSMAKMKLVTPKMTDIRTRFKGEPQKMNAAMMELYKKEKINPIGGCFPMIVQIPVFISLYWVLLASVEIRNASWLWVHDLASPDILLGAYDIFGFHLTIGILPILMAVSMFIQTKLNPTPPDPIQAKVMMWMPIVFSIMFFFFPAGLVLYWVVNNILSIAQQWFINEKLMGGTKAVS